jgi:hypothetical protein
LSYDYRSRAYDQYFVDVGSFWHLMLIQIDRSQEVLLIWFEMIRSCL